MQSPYLEMQKFCLLPSYIMITISKYCADLYVHLLTSIIKYLKFLKHSRTTYKSTSLWIECCRRWIAWLKAWPFLRAGVSQLVHNTLSSFIAWCEVQVCRSGSKDFCTPQKDKKHGFICFLPFLYLHFYFPSCIIIHACFFLFPQRVPLDLEVGGGKSILTRTKTLPTSNCFKEPLLFITLCLMRMCFHLLFIAIRTWK